MQKKDVHSIKDRASRFFIPIVFFMSSLAFAANTVSTLGMPNIIYPADNPPLDAKIALGQKLFFDQRLSADGKISCASCHQPEHAFSDGRALAQGVDQQLGTRNTPSLLNGAFNTSQFWDGRRTTLESQASDPLLNPREHGLADSNALLSIVQKDPHYAVAFRIAFNIAPEAISVRHISEALANFERSELVAGNSAFDRYQYAGEKSSLSASAARGLQLFEGRAQCVTCHTIGEKSALFTDNDFHSLSIGMRRIEQRLPQITTNLVALRQAGKSLDQTVLTDEDIAELGRFAVTLNPVDIGKFRTPSLRNVALTAPYMHDGSVPTLAEAIELEIYYRGAEAGHPLILTPIEKNDLEEFLKSLNSEMNPRWHEVRH